MASQLLVNVLSIGPLAGGPSTTVAHGLKSNDVGVVPTQVLCDQASPIAVTSTSTTSITFTNLDVANPASAVFRAEYDHSIHAVGASPVNWQGYIPTYAAAGVAVFGQFYSAIDQTVPTGTGVSVISFENTYSSNGVSCVDPGTGFKTQLTVATTGVYAFNISPQLIKTSGGGHGTVTFWARKSGVNVADSGSFVAVTNNEHILSFVELILPMTAGEYIEWACNSDVANCRLEHETASVAPAVVRPAAPSVIAGVKLIGN